jgi:hypothetical protein
MCQGRLSFVPRMLAIGAMLAMASQLALAATISCPRAAFPPVLDGHLDDWPPLPQIVIAEAADWHAASPEAARWGGPRDMSAEVRLAWDSQALYLAIETTDDHIVRVRSAAEIDRGDSLVLGLRGDDPAPLNQFVVALLRTASLVWRAEPAQSAGEVRTVARALALRDEDGSKKLLYELSIPWAELRQIRPIAGTALALTVSACDDDGAGLKGCIERTTRIKLSTADIGSIEETEGAGARTGAAPVFPAPERERFDEKCLILKGRDVLLLGGEVQYWLLPEAAWAGRLRLLRAAGLNTIGITVPWSHHQPLPGPVELGELRRFLEICKSAGLWVQLSIGPSASEELPAGGVPGWVRAMPNARDRQKAAEAWVHALLPVVGDFQLAKGGPVAYITIGAAPTGFGTRHPAVYQQLFAAVRSAGITVPVLAPDALIVRNNALANMANIVASLSFYEPVEAETLAARVALLERTEVGPAIITALPGDYRDEQQARRSIDRVRVALAKMSAGVTLSDFAPGLDPAAIAVPGSEVRGIVDPAGGLTPGYAELRLLGAFLRRFGAALVRSTVAEGVVEADDPDVRVAARYGQEASFLLLWDEKGRRAHQVRVRYLLPDGEKRISIPEAGAIHLPPSGAKILLLDTPFGRGAIRYCTSEVAALHQLGERWLLVVYGDADTPGEIAISLPGPPLVSGDAARQAWDAASNTLVLDYYHSAEDRYILVDELEIAVLSRERAKLSGLAADGPQAVTLVAGAGVAEASLGSSGVQAAIDCRPGVAQASAALPRPATAVLVDGKSVPFEYRTPERVVTFEINTPSFSEQQRPTSVLDRLGRAIVGGPPYLYARFDRALFMAETEAPRSACSSAERIAGAPEELSLVPGAIAKLRTRFSAEGATELVVSGSSYPLLVSLNGLPVEALCGTAPARRADISRILRSGSNELEVIAQIVPHPSGVDGMRDRWARLPEVKLLTPSGEVALIGWEVCPGLDGEAAGYARSGVDERRWYYIRLGPWREQGRELADVTGVGWYRMTFKLPPGDGWTIPYYLDLDLRGAGKVYFNGRPIAAVAGSGEYRLPVPSSLGERDNVLALALYGVSPDTGLYSAQVAADESRMTRRRLVEIRF